MRILYGFPGWGWKMYGLASFRSGSMWFVGFSKQLPKVTTDEATQTHGGCQQRGGEADHGRPGVFPE